MIKHPDRAYAFSYPLKHMLQTIIGEGKMAEAEAIIAAVDDYIEQFHKRAGKWPSQLCRQIYKDVDALIEQAKYKGIQCRRGCAACCRINIDATQSEIKHLATVIKAKDIPIDIDLLTKQQGRDADTWLDLPYEDRKCVFLDEATNECRVYHDRPLNCRKYLVMSDPAHCDTRDRTNRPLVRFNPDAEIVMTAWMTAEPVGSLAEGILKEVTSK